MKIKKKIKIKILNNNNNFNYNKLILLLMKFNKEINKNHKILIQKMFKMKKLKK